MQSNQDFYLLNRLLCHLPFTSGTRRWKCHRHVVIWEIKSASFILIFIILSAAPLFGYIVYPLPGNRGVDNTSALQLRKGHKKHWISMNVIIHMILMNALFEVCIQITSHIISCCMAEGNPPPSMFGIAQTVSSLPLSLILWFMKANSVHIVRALHRTQKLRPGPAVMTDCKSYLSSLR